MRSRSRQQEFKALMNRTWLSGTVDPSAGYALYLPFSAASPTYRVGASTYSSVTALPGYAYTRSGSKGERNDGTRSGTYGPELVTNGTFDTVTTGWTAGGTTSLSIVAARLRVTVNGAAPYAYQTYTTAIGQVYRIQSSGYAGTAQAQVTVGTAGAGSSDVLVISDTAGDSRTFIATSTITTISLWCNSGTNGHYAEFDNISLMKLYNAGIDYFAPNEAGIVPGVGYWSRGALTNYVVQSQQFENAAWTKSEAVITANSLAAPDGTTTADTFTASANNLAQLAYASNQALTAAVHTVSVFAKKGTHDILQLFVGPNFSADYVNFDLTNGTRTNGGLATGYIVDCGNGWYRCVMVSTFAAFTESPCTIAMVASTASTRAAAFAGGVTKNFYIWGAQTLLGNHPDGGPIIATDAATASIGADVLSTTSWPYLADTDFFFWTVGTFTAATNGTGEIFARIGDQGWLGRNSAGNLALSDALSPVPNNIDTVAQGAGRAAIGLRRRAGSCTAFFKRSDGTVITMPETAVAWPVTNSNLNIGHYGGGFQANAKGIDIYARTGTFSDAECQAIMAAA